ncbi:MAG: endonuclease/exonuclease/phosphatase family protein [Polyangiales bacterium]
MPWKRRVAVFSLHLLGCAPEPPSRTPCETLVVATWNVRRLFDSRCDSGDCGPTRAEDRLPPDEVEASVRRVASAVRALDADVVVLEEIENRALLDRIVEAHGGTLSAAIGESPAPGSIDVAVIARVPIRRVRHHVGVTLALPDGRTTTPTRDLLEVELATAPRPVTVVGAHFKSQRLDDPERRHAEARFAADTVAAARARGAALVVLAGDLNDVPGSPTLRLLEDDGGLYRVTARLAPEAAFTIVHEGRPELLDHLFVPEVDRARVVPDGVFVVHGAGVGYGGSDHAAVRASFRLGSEGDGGRGTVGPCAPPSSSPPSASP